MGKVADWSQYSEKQLRALLNLSFAVPMHVSYLRGRLGVRENTVRSLIAANCAKYEMLFDEQGNGVPFVTLTRFDLAVRRDYTKMARRLAELAREIGGEPAPFIQAILAAA